MAFNVVDTSYSGTYSKYMITKATFEMDTVRKGVVHLATGIKKKHTIARLDYNNPLKPRMVTPTTDNANPFTIDGRLLIPKSVDVYEEFNPRDLEENQLAESLKDTILDRRVPNTLQNQMVQLVLDRAGEQYENGLWMGSLAYAGKVDSEDARYQLQYFDGFMVKFVNDASINRSSISPVTITTSNVLLIMNDLISQATSKKKALITRGNTFTKMKFLMSATTTTIYQQALSTGTQFKGTDYTSGQIPQWAGYKVERLAGMPDDTILFCCATKGVDSALWAGMNSMEDWDLKLMQLANNSELWFIQGKWKWDVNYGWGEEIFLYTTLTANNFIAA